MAEDLPLLCSRCNNNVKKVHNDELYESWSSTPIKVVKLKHTWTISNYNFSCEEKLESPTFSAGSNSEKLEWCLSIYPNGKIESGDCRTYYVPLYLNLVKGNKDGKQAKAQCGLVNVKGENITITDTIDLFKSQDNCGWDTFTNHEFLYDDNSECLVDNKLTIFCEITTVVGNRNISTPHIDLSLDFTFLLVNKHLSDVIISAEGIEFPAHKVILSAQSPVFRTMFQQESMKNRVKITDIDKESLSEILRYMYTGKINKLEEMAPRLLGFAEKYQLNDLKIACENALMKILSLQNVVDLFILSDKHSAMELKNQVKVLIAAHGAVLGNTPEFQSIIRTHPDLGIEAFCALSGNLCSSK